MDQIARLKEEIRVYQASIKDSRRFMDSKLFEKHVLALRAKHIKLEELLRQEARP